RNEKKLLLEKHYLTQRNEEAESRILVLKQLARLVALEQEYKFGKFTTIRREEEVVREIGKLRHQIPQLPNWNKKFNEVQDPSEAIRQYNGEKRYLEKRTKSNQEYLKKIQQVLTQISNAQPQSVQASVRPRPVESSAQVKPSARLQLAGSSAQPHQSSPSRRQQDDRTIKVTHLPRYMEVSQLEQELSGIFGDIDSLGSTLSHPVQRLYVAPSKNIAFITYFKKEDAETVVERLSKCHLGYNILRVEFASPRSDNA
uniref:RRM domain-containing protein n=1 Tax=Acrobeloides nanus TaxID=290746 RepID=A0A914D735_9BILA